MSNIPDDRREKFQSIYNLITSLYPKAKISMKYKMPTFEYQDGWVALANQKNYISFYTCGYHHIEKFKTKYPKIKTGKGCINIRKKDEFDLADLKQVIQHAIEHPK